MATKDLKLSELKKMTGGKTGSDEKKIADALKNLQKSAKAAEKAVGGIDEVEANENEDDEA